MARNQHNPFYEIRRSSIHGRGAFALRRIRKGTRIVEYTGQRISDEEADRRDRSNGQIHEHTFLFSTSDHGCIDAGRGGNSARYINHSCNPNCEAVDEDGRIFIEAIRNIQPGVELSYDYMLTGPAPRTKAERAKVACFCGAPNCRGIMTAARRRNGQAAR